MEKGLTARNPDAALRHSRLLLLEQLQQREKEQSILLHVGSKIANARERSDLWDIITVQLLNLLGAQYYTLCLINEDGVTHTPYLHSQEKSIRTRAKDSPIVHAGHPIEDGIFNVALASNEPVIFDLEMLMKVKNIPPYIINWYNSDIREMMVVKICNGKEARGVLYLYAQEHGSFTVDKFNLLLGIADQLGTGICNIRALETIQQQLEAINKYKQQLEQENLYLQEEQKLSSRFSEMIGSSAEMQKVCRLLSQVAMADSTILILGETGTGKELIARAIHHASARRNKLMIKVNCAALPANLIESELFGHEKGSFTGALEKRVGKFELANNSSLFLDEIGELPLELQAKLLRVLQEKEIERIGGKGTIKVNVRIIVATNRNLEKEVQAGRFRSDLYYRLNVVPITLPPLRKRKEDIPALVSHFIERYAQNAGKKINNISHKAMEMLMGYDWPGNIRELEHLIERTVLLTNTSSIKEVLLPAGAKKAGTYHEEEFVVKPLDEMEREYILKVIKHCKGRISGPNGAAVKLNMPSTTLTSKMQRLGIKKEHFVQEEE
ncbi:Transcriptional regulator containing GAF, AAA-type ATPase, and DNA-binding Fis domains [Filimonas lacunae]|uniref:Transcriptional regulator containing GAF, AAA-type ATPase, and DNA-binding Fis domains n=1 Tax=Filimonas lacunae TaxID=477680 RepID=A0A173MG81_9BACT|nr:sigma 54-interacting transcriptional regulator [Filimonas lacunae]BAV06487.1 formate hydrogenlyase transcriptional activator [Filimonas lacunae]SIT27133.1 Transcriptional regulator containing GAF, AAA-type ATPase, and DNA-binding Fis domains [Filimonas lacunae]